MHTSHIQKQVNTRCVPGQIKLLNAVVVFIFKALYIYRFRYLYSNILICQVKPNQTLVYILTGLDFTGLLSCFIGE